MSICIKKTTLLQKGHLRRFDKRMANYLAKTRIVLLLSSTTRFLLDEFFELPEPFDIYKSEIICVILLFELGSLKYFKIIYFSRTVVVNE